MMKFRSTATSAISTLGLAAVLVAALLACKASKPEETATEEPKAPAENACPAKARLLPGGEGTCTCPAGPAEGSVWGTGMYTSDSNPCKAAVHAGVISATGGSITLKAAAGCSKYKGSEANGVETGGWGPYSGSFYFPKLGVPSCPTGCATSFSSVSGGKEDAEYSCTCKSEDVTGSLYGSHPYTADSSPCKAAAHLGIISKDSGGKITVKGMKGCSSYEGSTKNGETSSKWGSYGASFYFPEKGSVSCK